MALWQRCVHLGCRVPQCQASQGFECPCHGSKYNYHGEYEDGPAPRNLDRFVVEIDETGQFIIDTGTEYPQGPSCI
jgi:cytochrome b6-f complex iron-sulfur subunit